MPTFIYYILEGKVGPIVLTKTEKNLSPNCIQKGDYFGYFELLQDKHYTDYAAALEDVKVALISKEDFFNVILGKSRGCFIVYETSWRTIFWTKNVN
jgi:CRP-like cAMP-binding protein